MIVEEWEPKKAEEDMIVENAEIKCGNILVQKAQIINMDDAIPVLRQNLQEEESMAAWLETNTLAMLTQLWPRQSLQLLVVVVKDNKLLLAATSQKKDGTSEDA